MGENNPVGRGDGGVGWGGERREVEGTLLLRRAGGGQRQGWHVGTGSTGE